MADIKFLKTVVFTNSLVPVALLGWDAYHRRLGANPLEFVTHTTGALTLIFLLVSLAEVKAVDGHTRPSSVLEIITAYSSFRN